MDEQTCQLFNPKNVDELVEKIVWAINIKENERNEISQKLSTNVRLNFSKNILPTKTAEIYEYVLKNKM